MDLLILPAGLLIGCAAYFAGFAVWGTWFPDAEDAAGEPRG